MSWITELRALRQQVRVEVANAVARLFLWTTTANSTELGKEDAVRLSDDDPDEKQRSARRIEPFGFRSRPVAKQRCLSLRLGSSTVLYLGVASDGGYGPTDLADGETALYSKSVERGVHLKDSGDVALESRDGQVVSVNGDDYSLPQWDDFMTELVGTFLPALSADIVSANAGGLIGPPSSIVNFLAAIATALEYKSRKAKNG